MRRKVIKQANQAYTITLPIDWVRENEIDKTRELEIETHEKTITLTNPGKTARKKVVINTTGASVQEMYRIINALYAKGIDEIELTTDECTSKISEALNNTIGYALVSKEKDTFIIKDIGGTTHENLDEIFKRTFQMILSFFSSAIEDIFKENEETLPGLKARDREINKFAHYLQRAINKKSYPDQIKGRVLFTYSFELEKMGDEIERLWRTHIKYKINTTKEIEKLAKDSLRVVEKVFESYFIENTKNPVEVYKMRNKLREDSMKIKDNAITTRAVRHIVKIAEEAVDLTHLNLMMKL